MSAVITPYGVQTDSQAHVMANLKADFRRIYGEDIELEPNTPDGQIVGIYAQAISDVHELIKNLFASLFPSTAEGNFLDWNLDLISLRRISGSPAVVNLRLDFDGTYDIEEGSYVVNIQGTNFANDKAITEQGLYSFTAADSGAMQFSPDEPVSVTTPVIGVSASYESTISNGSDYENDTDFRRRWRNKVSNRDRSATHIEIAIEQIDGVEDCRVYEVTDVPFDGIPRNSIYAVVKKGNFDYGKVLDAIYRTKTPGIRSHYTNSNPEQQAKFGDGKVDIGFDFATTEPIPSGGFKFTYKASRGEANEGDILNVLKRMRFRIGETVFVSDVERHVLDSMPELFANKGNNINGSDYLQGRTGVIYEF